MRSHPITVADLNRHIARKFAAELAQASEADNTQTANPTPANPATTHTDDIASATTAGWDAGHRVGTILAQASVDDASFRHGYRAGWRCGLADGALLGAVSIAALVAAGYQAGLL